MTSLNYARPFEPPTRAALIALPPGAVEPQGWLRDWCLAARDGYTGHMDEVDQAFRQAWADDYQMTGEHLAWPRGAWPYEGGGYWFDGLGRLGYILHDEALIAQAKRRIGVLAQHMQPDSILFLWWLDRNNAEHRQWSAVDDHWPCWASGLLGRAMSGYYAGSHDPAALHALEMAYSGGYDALRMGWGMSNPWPAFDAYTQTGNKQIAAGLDALFAPDGAKDSSWARYRHLPKTEPGAEANDHVVHFLESTTPWALGYLWTGKREFLDTALAWHDLLADRAMQPHGVPVSDEYWGPTGAFRGSETCDVAGYVWSQIALLTVSGQGRLADRVERAFFNAGPATVSRDFKTHVYFQSPNRIAPGSPDYPHGPRAEGGQYAPTHQPLCCTAALNRIVPNYVQHMWLATHDNGLAAACYGPCKLTALVSDKVPVTIDCRTNYPFDETITLHIDPAREVSFPLSLRLPGWCAAPELSVNGQVVPAKADATGFARLERAWKPGDTVALRLPMTAGVTTGHDVNAGAATATGGTVTLEGDGAPYATVSYGPLLFALSTEGRDINTADPAAHWQVALSAGQLDLTVKRGAMPARWDWPQAAPLTIETTAAPVDWPLDLATPKMPATPLAATGARQPITLVPYGCTKLRLSMFPVAKP
ncbi:MAG: glycoside hydrolase family 127 protein [Armatimonadetes bacterium]|nr:glycoside hydrolase family 127 protein [Armatimonadota bacterium]